MRHPRGTGFQPVLEPQMNKTIMNGEVLKLNTVSHGLEDHVTDESQKNHELQLQPI